MCEESGGGNYNDIVVSVGEKLSTTSYGYKAGRMRNKKAYMTATGWVLPWKTLDPIIVFM